MYDFPNSQHIWSTICFVEFVEARWCRFLALEIDIVRRRLLQCHYKLMVKTRGEVGMIGSMQI